MRAVRLIVAGAMCVHAQMVELREVAAGLGDVVTDIQQPPGDPRLFIVLRDGRILTTQGGAPELFLDIRSRVSSGGERGLLGLAFSPDFENKQYFYVNYTDLAGDTAIARIRAGANPEETVLLRIRQPFANHNGGQIRFGPDGYLYIGTGDGGGGGDPLNNAQNPRSLLGKLLRYDSETDPARFTIPPDNPFAGNPNFEAAVWALGLRNPWRFSWDRETGDLWIADVGQSRAEEVNFRPASSRGGENYGWNRMEGLQCFQPGCDTTGLTLPVFEYGRAAGCAVTGGFVYRGAAVTALRGQYLYGDVCTGRIWGLRREANGFVNREWLRVAGGVTTFGEDPQGEVYVGSGDGRVFRIAAGPDAAPLVLSAVNGASFVPGLVPGSIATVFVSGILESDGVTGAASIPLPNELDGVTVLVNGQAAPLYHVARTIFGEQVSFQTPFEAAGVDRVSIVVRRGALATAPFEASVLAAQPGIFTLDGANAVVVRSDGNTLVTAGEPLSAGEFVYFYATGLGAVTNPPATGAAASRSPLAHAVVPVRVTLGGVPAELLFAGLAPDFVGLFQINIRIPGGAPAGNAELVIEAGGVAAPPARVPVR